MDEKHKDRLANIVSDLAEIGRFTYIYQKDKGKTLGVDKFSEDGGFFTWVFLDEEKKDRLYNITKHALAILSEIDENELALGLIRK